MLTLLPDQQEQGNAVGCSEVPCAKKSKAEKEENMSCYMQHWLAEINTDLVLF